MGLFKDAKDAIVGAKQLGDHHGGMPSVRGAFKDIAALSDDRGQGEILKTGTVAKARVLGFAVPSTTEKFAMQIDLDVIPPTGEPYTVTYVYPTARQKTPLSVGMEVPIKIHPDNPMAIAVQWDALKGSIAASGGDMNVVMQGLQNTYQGTADAAARAYMAGKDDAGTTAAPVEDAEVRLKKLVQLRDAGLVTDEEFETKRAAIVADL